MTETTISTAEVTDVAGTGRAARRGLAGVLVALLVGGSVVLSDNPNTPYEGAAELIADFYAERDGGRFIEAWDDRFTAQFGGRSDQLEADVNGLLANGGQVVEQRLVQVAGVPLVAVATSDQIRWCVKPDGTILPTCVLGTMTATVDAGAIGATVNVLGGGLDLDGAEVTFDLTTTSPDAITLTGPAEVVGDDQGWQLVAATQLAGGDFFPPSEDGTLTIGGPFTVRLTMSANLGGSGQVSASTFDLVFPEGTIEVTIPGPDYWFG